MSGKGRGRGEYGVREAPYGNMGLGLRGVDGFGCSSGCSAIRVVPDELTQPYSKKGL